MCLLFGYLFYFLFHLLSFLLSIPTCFFKFQHWLLSEATDVEIYGCFLELYAFLRLFQQHNTIYSSTCYILHAVQLFHAI